MPNNKLIKNGQKTFNGAVYSAIAVFFAYGTVGLIKYIMPDIDTDSLVLKLTMVYTGIIAGVHNYLKHKLGFPWISISS